MTLSYGQTRPHETDKPIAIDEGQSIDHIDLKLPHAGVVAGHVTDESGEPMAGVKAAVVRLQVSRGRRSAGRSGGAADQ